MPLIAHLSHNQSNQTWIIQTWRGRDEWFLARFYGDFGKNA